MARKINDQFQMAAALLELDHEMTEHKKYIESIEAEVNQQDQELDILIDKLVVKEIKTSELTKSKSKTNAKSRLHWSYF